MAHLKSRYGSAVGHGTLVEKPFTQYEIELETQSTFSNVCMLMLSILQ